MVLTFEYQEKGQRCTRSVWVTERRVEAERMSGPKHTGKEDDLLNLQDKSQKPGRGVSGNVQWTTVERYGARAGERGVG